MTKNYQIYQKNHEIIIDCDSTKFSLSIIQCISVWRALPTTSASKIFAVCDIVIIDHISSDVVYMRNIQPNKSKKK